MSDFFASALSLVASDRAARGPSRLACREHLARAVELLLRCRRVAVVTGFFIPAVGAAETDGPGGAAALGRALSRSGVEASLWTDSSCWAVVEAASSAIGGVAVHQAEEGSSILRWSPDGLVFIERPGRASDGRYYDMRSQDISEVVVPLDDVVERDIVSVAVGDGGNEAGMGVLLEDLMFLMPEYGSCLSVISADVALPVDVSDWGGYALAAALSVSVGWWCGVDGEEVAAMIKAQVTAGAVDGTTLQGEPSVDGIPLEDHISLVQELRWSAGF
ncbi:MAG: hypothetical protein CSA35_09395 [Dethiosulfovibrio peptidovorans]|nr:MAG: hypothetical protein CSA35_09395 [Dethiosulfovibrio peptidovorans]